MANQRGSRWLAHRILCCLPLLSSHRRTSGRKGTSLPVSARRAFVMLVTAAYFTRVFSVFDWHCLCIITGVMQKNLTQTDVNSFRSILESERRKVSSALNDGQDVLAGAGAVSLDDQPVLLQEQFVSIHARRNDRRKLRAIDAALQRISAGEFGVCEGCEDIIPRRRLEAIPWAAYCVQCQERLVELAAQRSDIERVAA